MSASVARVLDPAPRSFLAFDFGTRRTGVATGNTLVGRAQPLKTLTLRGDARWAAIADVIREWQPSALVVGVPRHPDGAPHENTARARRFGHQLRARFGLPVHEVDERYTSTEAEAQLRTEGTWPAPPGTVDARCAAILLRRYLDGEH